MQYIYDNRTTVVRHSCDTFVRVSHDVRVNVSQFYFLAIKSQNVLLMSQFVYNLFVFVSHIHGIVRLAETKLRSVS